MTDQEGWFARDTRPPFCPAISPDGRGMCLICTEACQWEIAVRQRGLRVAGSHAVPIGLHRASLVKRRSMRNLLAKLMGGHHHGDG